MSIVGTAIDQQSQAGGWEKRGFVAGLAFVGVLIYWLSVWFPYQTLNTDADIRSFYYQDPSGARTLTPVPLLGPACLLFVWFLAALVSVLRRADGGRGILPWVALAGGIAFVVLLLAANAAFGAVRTASFFMPTFQLDPSVARIFSALSHFLGTQAAVAGSVLAGATALVAFRSDLPRSYAWTSAVVALLSALTVILIVPLFAFVGWIAVTAIVLLLRSPGETSAMAHRAGAAQPR
jgi:hypothetical protein